MLPSPYASLLATFSALCLAQLGGACSAGPDGYTPQTDKADQGTATSILDGDVETRLAALPIASADNNPLRVSRNLPDLRQAAALYDATFSTGDAMTDWLADNSPDSEAAFRGAMFASAFESEFRDDNAIINGFAWSDEDLRAAYALAWIQATENNRITLGDGVAEINAATFHIVVTQLLARGQTVISGRVDHAGAVYTGYEIKGGANGSPGPREIDRSTAESILRRDVDDAEAYHQVFASIRTNTGFASESYVLATDAEDEIIAGYWTPSNSSFPALRPTRLWIARERPTAPEGMDFAKLDEVRDVFNGSIPGAIGDTYEFTGSPVAFTENKFFCAKVGMTIPDRFRVGDITVRAEFSPAAGESWNHDLQVRLFHAPPGNGLSLSRLAGAESNLPTHDEQDGTWTTSDFNFAGSETGSGPWQLRVCDMSSGGSEDAISGFVDAFSIEFHPLN